MLLHVPHAATWQPDALGGSSCTRRLLCLHELVTRHFQAALARGAEPRPCRRRKHLVIIHACMRKGETMRKKEADCRQKLPGGKSRRSFFCVKRFPAFCSISVFSPMVRNRDVRLCVVPTPRCPHLVSHRNALARFSLFKPAQQFFFVGFGCNV